MGIEYLKSAARLLNTDYVPRRCLDLPKEVLWVSVGQKEAKLQAVRVGGKKNSAARPSSNPTIPS